RCPGAVRQGSRGMNVQDLRQLHEEAARQGGSDPWENRGQLPDSQPGAYYVSAVDAGRVALLAGPYVNDHAAALAMVEAARALAIELNDRAWWYAYGTVRVAIKEGRELPVGK